MTCHLSGRSYVFWALFTRVFFLIFVALLCAIGAPSDNPIAGRWVGRSPDMIGRTEDVELRFVADGAAITGVLHAGEKDVPLENVKLQGRTLTFDAKRELRNRQILYHYDGTLTGDTLDFTVQNDDGSSFFRFTVHRAA